MEYRQLHHDFANIIAGHFAALCLHKQTPGVFPFLKKTAAVNQAVGKPLFLGAVST